MALGFNQAGLIFATSRKATVERRAMGLVNDKLALAREGDIISQDYQKSQNLRKLVWENSSGVQETLRFNNIVEPFNGRTSNFALTDSSGKMMLTTAKAKALGLDLNDNKYRGTRSQFLAQFIDPSTGTNFDPNDYPPGNNLGLNFDEVQAQYVYTAFNSDWASTVTEAFNTVQNTINNAKDRCHDNGKWERAFCYGSEEDLSTELSKIKASAQDMVNFYTEAKSTALSGLSNLGYTITSTILENQTNSKQAKQYKAEAELATEMLTRWTAILNVATSGAGNWGGDEDFNTEGPMAVIAALFGVNCGTGSTGGRQIGSLDYIVQGSSDRRAAMDLMILYDLEMFGYTNSKGEKRGDGHRVVDREAEVNAIFSNTELKQPESGSGNTSTVTPEDWVEYYDTMWKHLSRIGYVIDDQLYNPEYIENRLRQGSMYVEKQETGQTYQFSRVAWQTDGTTGILDVKDTQEISVAQLKYESKKEQLDTKEAQIDVEIQKLDTERASLEAQIDTIKSVITKNVERSFKMFQ